MKTITLILVYTSLMFSCIHSQAPSGDSEAAVEVTKKVGEIVQGTSYAILDSIRGILVMLASKPERVYQNTQQPPTPKPKQSSEKVISSQEQAKNISDGNTVKTESESTSEANLIEVSEEEFARLVQEEYNKTIYEDQDIY